MLGSYPMPVFRPVKSVGQRLGRASATVTKRCTKRENGPDDASSGLFLSHVHGGRTSKRGSAGVALKRQK
jgi:hypothetical protein